MSANFKCVLVATFLILNTACTMLAPKYNTSFENIAPLREEHLKKVAVGDVKPDPSVKQDGTESLSLRAAPFKSPYGSFSAYLKEALSQELEDAHLLDPKSPIEITAYILKNEISVPMDTGSAALTARFVVSHGTEKLFDKVKDASTTWPSSFFGATALSAGQINYPIVYQKLLQSLFSDIDFIGALKDKGAHK